MNHLTFIEPTWTGRGHLPANLGMLRVAHSAFSGAQLTYVGDQSQIDLLAQAEPQELIAKINFIPWIAGSDKDTLPTDAWAKFKRLRALPNDAVKNSDLIVLTSMTLARFSKQYPTG